MRHTSLLAALLLLLPFGLSAQQLRIPQTHATIDLPTGEWNYLKTIEVDKNTNVYLYVYTDSVVVDATGDTIYPFLRIYVHRNYAGSTFDLAYDRFLQQPFQSMDEYTDGIPGEGLGYLGAYQSTDDRKEYQFRMIYFMDKNTGIEIRMETTGDTYARFDKYFDNILRTVAITK
ncbi:MAG: hypothetical protein IJT39_07265 [Bacteroidales bacterium]|nr:hypothetical protein [Bacteroidales bacterium]